MKKYIALLLIYSLSSCNLLLDNDDRLEGHSAANPIISFKKYYMKEYRDYGMQPSFRMIDTLKRFDTLFVAVSEFYRSDGKGPPANGKNLEVTITTSYGDVEVFQLDGDRSFLGWADNITAYIQFINYKIYDNSSDKPSKYSGFLDVNNAGDKIMAKYASYWHGNIVKDTLIYLEEK